MDDFDFERTAEARERRIFRPDRGQIGLQMQWLTLGYVSAVRGSRANARMFDITRPQLA